MKIMGPNQKINLNAIMKNNSSLKNDDINKNEKKVEKIEKVKNTETTNDSSTNTNKKINIQNSTQKISLNELKEKKVEITKKEENIKNDQTTNKTTNKTTKKTEIKNTTKQDNKNEKKDEGEIFSNYTSDFKAHENIILSKIKKLKNLPKTNPKFLATIIILTIITIVFAITFDSKHHSIKTYQNITAKILGINTNWTKDNIKVKGFTFDIETKKSLDGINIKFYKNHSNVIKEKIIYKYKDTIYKNKDYLITFLNKEIKIKEKKKEEELKQLKIEKEKQEKEKQLKIEEIKKEKIKKVILDNAQKTIQ